MNLRGWLKNRLESAYGIAFMDTPGDERFP
jgi:hypothetical protein